MVDFLSSSITITRCSTSILAEFQITRCSSRCLLIRPCSRNWSRNKEPFVTLDGFNLWSATFFVFPPLLLLRSFQSSIDMVHGCSKTCPVTVPSYNIWVVPAIIFGTNQPSQNPFATYFITNYWQWTLDSWYLALFGNYCANASTCSDSFTSPLVSFALLYF